MDKRSVLTPTTIFRFLRKASFWSVLFFANAVIGCDEDLSSPEATVKGYCTNGGGIVQKYFNFNVDSKIMGKKIWSDCSVITVRRTDKVGQHLLRNLVVESDDVEVITEVKMVHPDKGNPTTRFWYLLRNFDGKWKIIEYSHIPDKNYPDYD